MMETAKEPRLLLVSNRLPATFRVEKHRVKVVPSAGGLATGLRSHHERSGGLWFGWPGDVRRLRPEQREDLDVQLEAMRLQALHLSGAEVDRFYLGFSNGVLWPLFHYLLDKIPLDSSDWEEYRRVNERFAELVASRHRDGDVVWIHDYHLMLVPQMLRERFPRACIGFFLHIPFPSSEVFRVLPWRAEVLRGILGADLIGFHTTSYLRHFSMSVLRILGVEADVNRIWHEGRDVRLGAYPMGIDAEAFESYARDPEIRAQAESIRSEGGGARIILCVDRLDYTKGLPRRLLAFEKLLEREPSLRGKVRLIQIAVPSRTEVQAYDIYKRHVDELVGRINGRWGTARYVPVHYLNQGFPQRDLAAFYLAADVMAVTPLRDGLNLVAKEYIATKADLDGVLVLSELAGAASELGEALLVNPYDLDQVAKAFAQALRMDPEERASRLRALRERVQTYDIHHWASEFLDDLAAATAGRGSQAPPVASAAEIFREIEARIHSAGRVVLFLDYDGTLTRLVSSPELAAPDRELLRLIGGLCSQPLFSVHLVSGRDRSSIERWFGALPLTLHAEHGLWTRSAGAQEWSRNLDVSTDWKPKVRPILDGFVKSTPGSFLEDKSAGIVWHYRKADPVFGASQAKELRLLLIELLSNVPVEVTAGEKIVEVRAQGAHKGSVVSRVLQGETNGALALAVGDDSTDEDMFSALPPGSIAIHAGPGPSRAPYRLAGPAEVRALMRSLAQ